MKSARKHLYAVRGNLVFLPTALWLTFRFRWSLVRSRSQQATNHKDQQCELARLWLIHLPRRKFFQLFAPRRWAVYADVWQPREVQHLLNRDLVFMFDADLKSPLRELMRIEREAAAQDAALREERAAERTAQMMQGYKHP